MTDTPTSSTNPIDKFSALIIKTFLSPIKSIMAKVKPATNVTDAEQTYDVDAPEPASEVKDGLTKKAIGMKKGRKFPKLPKGIPTRKVGIAIGVLVVVLIILNLSLGILRREPPIGDPTPVPTFEIDTSRPSIYAKDEEVLDLEERISVLDSELSNVVLRDITLRPPELDFNLSF